MWLVVVDRRISGMRQAGCFGALRRQYLQKKIVLAGGLLATVAKT